MASISCWAVTDGSTGMENQCVGLAERMGLTPEVKRIRLRPLWAKLSPFLRLGAAFALHPDSDRLEPPYPQLVISCGRRSILPAIRIRRASRGHTFAVHIQDPVIAPSHFDLVIVPAHDRLRGRNVVVTRGSLHNVTTERIKGAAADFADRFDSFPRPRIAALIGGNNAAYRLTPLAMGDLAEQLATLARTHGGSLLVTPSRRTGADNEAILRAHAQSVPSYVWDGSGANPYLAMLGLADYIIVTVDSVNMVTEACATGKPVFVADLEGGSPKFDAFHRSLREQGITRPFAGKLETWSYQPLDDSSSVARIILQKLSCRSQAQQAPAPTAAPIADADHPSRSRLDIPRTGDTAGAPDGLR